MWTRIGLRSLLFLVIGCFIFLVVQKVLTPDWSAECESERTIHGISSLDENDLDVIFLGNSHVYSGISPMVLYQEYGILSYAMSTPTQPIAGGYFLLDDIFKKYHPKTVVLDIGSIYTHPGIPHWRYILDNLKVGTLKYKLTTDYLKLEDTEESENFFNIMFPIIKYHSNWSGISKNNFRPESKTNYTNGQYMINIIRSSPYSIDVIKYEADAVFNYNMGKMIEFRNGNILENEIASSVYAPDISEQNLEYLLKIQELCKRHGSRLLLIKVPTMLIPQWNQHAWTQIKSEQIRVLAEELDVPFLDLMFESDLELSAITDTMDIGTHLNIFGAEKLSKYLGAYLLENGFAQRRESAVYEESLQKYKKVYTVMKLQTIVDFHEYIQFLQERKENWTIVVAAADDYVSGMTEQDYDLLEEFGLKLIGEGEFRDSYIGVISEGETLYEAVSDYELTYQVEVPGAKIDIHSKNGWLTEPRSSIQVNGQEYAISDIGLDIIVYDHETKMVIDSVLFNTFDPTLYSVRDDDLEISLAKDYESVLCFDGW